MAIINFLTWTQNYSSTAIGKNILHTSEAFKFTDTEKKWQCSMKYLLVVQFPKIFIPIVMHHSYCCPNFHIFQTLLFSLPSEALLISRLLRLHRCLVFHSPCLKSATGSCSTVMPCVTIPSSCLKSNHFCRQKFNYFL